MSGLEEFGSALRGKAAWVYILEGSDDVPVVASYLRIRSYKICPPPQPGTLARIPRCLLSTCW